MASTPSSASAKPVPSPAAKVTPLSPPGIDDEGTVQAAYDLFCKTHIPGLSDAEMGVLVVRLEILLKGLRAKRLREEQLRAKRLNPRDEEEDEEEEEGGGPPAAAQVKPEPSSAASPAGGRVKDMCDKAIEQSKTDSDAYIAAKTALDKLVNNGTASPAKVNAAIEELSAALKKSTDSLFEADTLIATYDSLVSGDGRGKEGKRKSRREAYRLEQVEQDRLLALKLASTEGGAQENDKDEEWEKVKEFASNTSWQTVAKERQIARDEIYAQTLADAEKAQELYREQLIKWEEMQHVEEGRQERADTQRDAQVAWDVYNSQWDNVSHAGDTREPAGQGDVGEMSEFEKLLAKKRAEQDDGGEMSELERRFAEKLAARAKHDKW